jgi:hypothetical protein
MNINRFNFEGYSDPTAYKALQSVINEQKKLSKLLLNTYPYKPIVFICSPFAGEVELNIEKAKRYARFAVDNGAIPIIPHLMYPQFMKDDDSNERKLALEMGLVLLGRCKELWYFGSHISDGMVLEINKAKIKEIVIRHFTGSCELVDEMLKEKSV